MSKWDKYKLARKKWKQENPEKIRHYRLMETFGISLDTYNGMLEDQNGVCAICEQPETMKDNRTGKLKNLSVDHDHETDEVRALLCNACNIGLGKFKDDAGLLYIAAKYLESFRDT